MDLVVYDIKDLKKRTLDKNNISDIKDGFIYFTLDIIPILKERYSLLKFMIVDEKGEYIIDIMSDKICFFETEYNKLDDDIKEKISKYNITNVDGKYITAFMYDWQFECDFDCFKNYDPIYEISSKIVWNVERVKRAYKLKIWLDIPKTYVDYCDSISKLIKIFDLDYSKLDIKDEIKELLRSAEKKLLIEYTNQELDLYFKKFCVLFMEKEEFLKNEREK